MQLNGENLNNEQKIRRTLNNLVKENEENKRDLGVK